MADTDAMGIVYHGNYLAWFEAARNELIRSWGIPYTEFLAQGIGTVVTEAEIKWRYPARFEDLVEVWTLVEEMQPVRFSFRYQVLRQSDEKLLCEGVTRHAFVDASGRPVALSKAAPALWERLNEKLK